MNRGARREETMKQSGAVQKRVTPTPFLKLVTADETLERMKRTFDAIARRAFGIFEANGRKDGRELADWLQAEAELLHPVHLELTETERALTVRAEAPGFTEKDFEIDLEPSRLTITAARESRSEHKKGKTVYTEQCSDEIFRVVDLPAEVDTASSDIKATYERGVLTITLPKREKPKSREIKVESKPATG
jgi:HSP20 family protein